MPFCIWEIIFTNIRLLLLYRAIPAAIRSPIMKLLRWLITECVILNINWKPHSANVIVNFRGLRFGTTMKRQTTVGETEREITRKEMKGFGGNGKTLHEKRILNGCLFGNGKQVMTLLSTERCIMEIWQI